MVVILSDHDHVAERPAGELLTAAEYRAFLEENWDKTQRMIKGKINTED